VSAKLRYMAILSDDPGLLGDFYSRHFGFETLGRSAEGDVSLSDGFYNLTFLKNRPDLGEVRMERGLHHLGLQVDDLSEAVAKYLSLYPGNVVVTEEGGLHHGERRLYDPESNPVSIAAHSFGVGDHPNQRPRIAHIALNALVPERLLCFYSGIFGLRELTTSFRRRETGRLNRFAGDGITNLAIHPYYNMSKGHEARLGMNHFGILVEDMDKRLEALAKEIAVAKRPADRPYAEYRLRDPEGNAFDLSQVKGWEIDIDRWDKAA